MKKMLCSTFIVFIVMLLLSACGRETVSTFEQYANAVDGLVDEELSAVFSEKHNLDELIIGEPVSIITDERWQKGINNDHYHASGIDLAGYTATISIIQENEVIQRTNYEFSAENGETAQDIVDAAIAALGEPDMESSSDDMLSLYWNDSDLTLMLWKSLNRITVS